MVVVVVGCILPLTKRHDSVFYYCAVCRKGATSAEYRAISRANAALGKQIRAKRKEATMQAYHSAPRRAEDLKITRGHPLAAVLGLFQPWLCTHPHSPV